MSDTITTKIRLETHAKLKELKRLTGVNMLHRLDEVVTVALRRARRDAARKAAA